MKETQNVEKMMLDFGMQIIALYRMLVFNEKEFVFSKRLLTSGSDIGAKVCCGQMKKAWKRAVETKFWLELVKSAVNAKSFSTGSQLLAQKLRESELFLTEIIAVLEEIKN